jgi:peptidoglycan-N-acetylglucosamine deacetylase
MPELLRRLKAGGYKIVFMKPKAPMQTLPEYDEEMMKEMKLPVASTRPVGNVIQTVSQ